MRVIEKIVQTPNIDAFAREGVRFTNAFAQASVCSQSRCSMVSEASFLRIITDLVNAAK